jgi:hypothetical protein
VVVLQGKGIFSGGDGIEHTFGPNTLLVFDPGENHSIRAWKSWFSSAFCMARRVHEYVGLIASV